MSTMNHGIETSEVHELAFRVNERRLLGEVGLLFSSATAAFAECVQNSYRAGASTLRVIADPTARTVMFRDNGEGLVDPEKLLTVAETGWDESRVKHAAGVGGFALWALATEVEVRSMPANGAPPWRMSFTDAALRGDAPVLVEPMAPTLWTAGGDEAHGIEIRATLKETATFPALDERGSAVWRHRFPLAITIDVAGVNPDDGRTPCTPTTYTVAPHAGYTIETPVGNLYVGNDLHHPVSRKPMPYGYMVAVEWEHRDAGVVNLVEEVLTPDVCEGMPKTVIHELVHRMYLRDVPLVWVVAPTANVEAKLPDRETLVRDEGFRSAMRVIARALLAEFNIGEIRDTLVELIHGAPICSIEDVHRAARMHQLRPRFGKISLAEFDAAPFLQLAGYHRVSGGRLLADATYSLDRDGDPRFEVQYETPSYMVKPHYVTPFAELAVAQGLPAVHPTAVPNAMGLTPLSIAAGELLIVSALNAVFARDLRFLTPDGSTVASVAHPLWKNAFEDLTPDLTALDSVASEIIYCVFPLPSTEEPDRTLPDAVMAYVQRSAEFERYVTIMAAEGGGMDFALDLWEYVEPDGESWDEIRLAADARRCVADVLGASYRVAAERTAALADLISTLSVPLVTNPRLADVVERGRAAGISESHLNAIIRATETLRAGLHFLRKQEDAVVQ